jgi:hypothetical protein
LRRRVSTALLLAGLIGVLFMGVGHFYLRRTARGLMLLIAGLLTWIGFVAAMVGAFFTIGILFGIALVSLWIFQMYDALRLTRRYNEWLETTSRPPW